MISRTALILSTLAFCTLATQDANAACKNGVCSLRQASNVQVRTPKTVRKVAAVKMVKGCGKCKKAKKVKRNNSRRNNVVRTRKQGCANGICRLARK